MLPPALEAFHITHSGVYTAYAQAHLTPDAADAAVRTAFGVLAANWSYLLGEPNLTALAWEELVLQSQSRRRPLAHIAAVDPLQYDALVLTGLGLSPGTIANIMGRHTSTIRYLIAPHVLHADNLLPINH